MHSPLLPLPGGAAVSVAAATSTGQQAGKYTAHQLGLGAGAPGSRLQQAIEYISTVANCCALDMQASSKQVGKVESCIFMLTLDYPRSTHLRLAAHLAESGLLEYMHRETVQLLLMDRAELDPNFSGQVMTAWG